MLETIREFALEQLEAADEADALHRSHAEYFLALGESANLTAESVDPERPEIVRSEQDNFRAAIDWAIDREPELAFRLTIALEQFWVMNDPFEGVQRLQKLLEQSRHVSPLLHARALRVYGESAWMAGDYGVSHPAEEESLRVFREVGDELGTAIALHRIAVGATKAGDFARARALLDECLAILERHPNPKVSADAIVKLGNVEWREGNLERAIELWEEGGAQCEAVGFTWMQAAAVLSIADVAKELGRTELAWARAREGLRLCRACDDRQMTLFTLALLAQLERESGRAERAGQLWGAIEAEESRGPVGHWENERNEIASTVIDPSPEFDDGRASGRALSLDEAAELALAEPG